MEYNFRLMLLAHFPDGRAIHPADFIEPLALRPEDRLVEVFPGGKNGGSARIVFLDLDVTKLDIEDYEQGWSDLYLPVQEYVADWLALRPLEVFEEMRAGGLVVELFVSIEMDQNQMDFLFSPRLLYECGRKNLRIYLITNDIPASALGWTPPPSVEE